MESGVTAARLTIEGMTCVNCQNRIEQKLRSAPGVKSVQVSYTAGTADVSYDSQVISLKEMLGMIEQLGYKALAKNEKAKSNALRAIGILGLIVALYMLLSQFGVLNVLAPSQLADGEMGYGMLFVIGLLTSVHCIAMCGGINLSQCVSRTAPQGAEGQSRMATFAPSLLYNLGRVASYTAVGFVLGLAGLLFGGQGLAGDSGSAPGLSTMAQGILKLVAGVFMVIMGMNMLALFPALRKLQPRLPRFFSPKPGKSRSPLIVGLLNGFMPCGPLQSMQIVALASGNPLTGALSMLLFSLGTVPLMLGLGSIVSALGKRFTRAVMTVGAVLVVVLGLAMLSQGGSLSGLLLPNHLLGIILVLCAWGIVSSIPFKRPRLKAVSTIAAVGIVAIMAIVWNAGLLGGTAVADGGSVQMADGKQMVSSTLAPGSYPSITVEVGKPVQWTINAPEGSINGCNNRINIQEYGIANYTFQPGDNVIEFTPTETGRFQYSCWMGMIRAYITVTEPGGAQAGDPSVPLPDGGGNDSLLDVEPVSGCCCCS